MPDPYVCPTCGTRYVVPTLTELCEKRHQEGR